MFKFCTYDQTHGENLDCVSQLEIGQVGYLLNDPRKSSWSPVRLVSDGHVYRDLLHYIGDPGVWTGVHDLQFS